VLASSLSLSLLLSLSLALSPSVAFSRSLAPSLSLPLVEEEAPPLDARAASRGRCRDSWFRV